MKMHSITKIIFLLGISIFFENSFAYLSSIDGKDLVEMCQTGIAIYNKKIINSNKDETYKAAMCAGYINGTVDMNFGYSVLKTKNKSTTYQEVEKNFLFCIPNNVSTYEIANVYIKYMETNPRLLHQSANMGLLKAISEAYPCQKNIE